MTNEFREWVQAQLPGVCWDGGRYWRMLKVGEVLLSSDKFRCRSEFHSFCWQVVGELHGHTLVQDDVAVYEYRRPIPRPTEALLEAMHEPSGLGGFIDCWVHPVTAAETFKVETAIGWLDALEQADKPAPSQGMEDEDAPDDNSLDGKLANADSVEAIALLMERVEDLEAQNAALTAERDGLLSEKWTWDTVAMHHDQLNREYNRLIKQAAELESHLTTRATAAESARDEAVAEVARLQSLINALRDPLSDVLDIPRLHECASREEKINHRPQVCREYQDRRDKAIAAVRRVLSEPAAPPPRHRPGGGDVSTKIEYVVEYRDKRYTNPNAKWSVWELYDNQSDAESLAERLSRTIPGVGRVFRIIRRETTETVLTDSKGGAQ